MLLNSSQGGNVVLHQWPLQEDICNVLKEVLLEEGILVNWGLSVPHRARAKGGMFAWAVDEAELAANRGATWSQGSLIFHAASDHHGRLHAAI
jgi:hypothetical protein